MGIFLEQLDEILFWNSMMYCMYLWQVSFGIDLGYNTKQGLDCHQWISNIEKRCQVILQTAFLWRQQLTLVSYYLITWIHTGPLPLPNCILFIVITFLQWYRVIKDNAPPWKRQHVQSCSKFVEESWGRHSRDGAGGGGGGGDDDDDDDDDDELFGGMMIMNALHKPSVASSLSLTKAGRCSTWGGSQILLSHPLLLMQCLYLDKPQAETPTLKWRRGRERDGPEQVRLILTTIAVPDLTLKHDSISSESKSLSSGMSSKGYSSTFTNEMLSSCEEANPNN